MRLKTFVVDKILGVHDSPHRIALGVAIGIFVTWTPTIGFQMALTLALSTLCRANKVVGVPLVWISNPATLWIYIPNYLLGCKILGENPSTDALMQSLIKAFGINDHGLKERFTTLIQTLWDVLAPLMLGSVIIGAFLGAIAYAATYKGVQIFQSRRALSSSTEACGAKTSGEITDSSPKLSSDRHQLSGEAQAAEQQGTAAGTPSVPNVTEFSKDQASEAGRNSDFLPEAHPMTLSKTGEKSSAPV